MANEGYNNSGIGLQWVGVGAKMASDFAGSMSEARAYGQTAESIKMAIGAVEGQTKYKALRSTLALRKTIGSQMSTFGAFGIVGNTGSALDVIRETVKESVLSKLMDRWNANMIIAGYEQAIDDYKKAKSRAEDSARMGLVGGILGGIIGGPGGAQAGSSFGSALGSGVLG